jgi:phospho-N-acetylmuramoyl-pentapeptide-transferase
MAESGYHSDSAAVLATVPTFAVWRIRSGIQLLTDDFKMSSPLPYSTVLQCMGAAITAGSIVILCGQTVIRWLRGGFRERIDSGSERLNELHAGKNSTPTLGGLLISAAVVIAALIWSDITHPFVLTGLISFVALTILGATDDLLKIRTRSRGLSARQKLLGQIAVGIIAGYSLTSFSGISNSLSASVAVGSAQNVPVRELTQSFSLSSLLTSDSLPRWMIVAWSAFVITSFSNAVNLTDGLDGLASGCTLTTVAAFLLTGLMELALASGTSENISSDHLFRLAQAMVLLSGLAGAVTGFLWFNCFPAAVFMGDAGALSIGGLLAVMALGIRQELLLPVAGCVFVAETLSVILQVTSFRLTGRRIFRCSPLHHHFIFRGDHEQKVVTRFWIVSALGAIAAVFWSVCRVGIMH